MEAVASETDSSEKDLVVVCGTVYMMADVREELGFDEPRVGEPLFIYFFLERNVPPCYNLLAPLCFSRM